MIEAEIQQLRGPGTQRSLPRPELKGPFAKGILP
jgi:hypothetical protein